MARTNNGWIEYAHTQTNKLSPCAYHRHPFLQFCRPMSQSVRDPLTDSAASQIVHRHTSGLETAPHRRLHLCVSIRDSSVQLARTYQESQHRLLLLLLRMYAPSQPRISSSSFVFEQYTPLKAPRSRKYPGWPTQPFAAAIPIYLAHLHPVQFAWPQPPTLHISVPLRDCTAES